MDLFVYGTLTDPRLLRALTGRLFTLEAASLDDYERIVPTHGYPFIRARPGQKVHGLVVRHVDEATLRKIDEYEAEGDLYQRRMVTVRVGDVRQSCAVYTVNESLVTADGVWKFAGS